MTAKPMLHTAEVDPRTHQGPLAFLRDWFVTEARQTFRRAEPVAIPKHAVSMGAPALSTHDLQDSGCEWALNDLGLSDAARLMDGDRPKTLAEMDAIVRDVCGRLKRRFETLRRQASDDRARIRQLESLVQERAKETDALRRRVTANEQRLDDIVQHNDLIANRTQALVLASDALLNLAKRAPELLLLTEQ